MTDLAQIQDARAIGYLTGVHRNRAADPRYAVALYAKPVNLLEQPCTCAGSGVACPVCRAWDEAARLNETRRLHAVRT